MNCLQCGTGFSLVTGKELFCSKECYEDHEDAGWDYSDGGNFRRAQKVERAVRANGSVVYMRLCEEKEAGRWEPFYSIERIEKQAA